MCLVGVLPSPPTTLILISFREASLYCKSHYDPKYLMVGSIIVCHRFYVGIPLAFSTRGVSKRNNLASWVACDMVVKLAFIIYAGNNLRISFMECHPLTSIWDEKSACIKTFGGSLGAGVSKWKRQHPPWHIILLLDWFAWKEHQTYLANFGLIKM